jgi:hypothetical protein
MALILSDHFLKQFQVIASFPSDSLSTTRVRVSRKHTRPLKPIFNNFHPGAIINIDA